MLAGVMTVSACSVNVRSGEVPSNPSVASSTSAFEQPTPSTPDTTIPVSPTDLPTAPAITPEKTAGDCETPYLPAYPGSRYKQTNADDMQKQLDALIVAKSQDQKVTLRDVANAEAISLNALADPAYAEAFTYANRQQLGTVPTAQELLDRKFTGPDCITGKQLQQVSDLYDALLTGLAPKAGRQMSNTAKAAWELMKKSKDAFVKKYHEQLSQ